VIIMQLLLPAFENVSGKHLALSLDSYAIMLLAFLALAIFTGLLAGSYPAFYLSSFIPVKVLKGRFSNSLAAVSLRKGLVVFQFVISVVLIIATVVISGQMRFLRSTDLGFAKDQQIVIPLQSQVSKNIYSAFKNELGNNKQVLSVGGAAYYPGVFNPSDNNFHIAGQSATAGQRVRKNYVDETYLQTLDIKPVAGRLFAAAYVASDTLDNIIINENAVKKLGFSSPQAAIGQKIYSEFKGQSYTNNIIGVVKDFHFEDLHTPITPYAFVLSYGPYHNYAIVHANAGEIGSLLKSIENSWHKLNPNEPFIYSFMDQDFQKNYISEMRLASIVNYFTLIAILISCLGLFGLATFSAEQRTKEIGVRKVLGASVTGIVALLSKEFLKLVIVAVCIASPIAWFAMNKWLQDFTYRINISWVVFVVTAIIALLIAFITISFQAIKAAVMNPVKSLRTE
ncbi:MAG: FtsX-like permease family protein, partial [Ferruginibacter sp.]